MFISPKIWCIHTTNDSFHLQRCSGGQRGKKTFGVYRQQRQQQNPSANNSNPRRAFGPWRKEGLSPLRWPLNYSWLSAVAKAGWILSQMFLDIAKSVQKASFTEMKGNEKVRGHVKWHRIEHIPSPFWTQPLLWQVTDSNCNLHSACLKSPISGASVCTREVIRRQCDSQVCVCGGTEIDFRDILKPSPTSLFWDRVSHRIWSPLCGKIDWLPSSRNPPVSHDWNYRCALTF